MSRVLTACVATAIVLGSTRTASATEHQWFLGGSAGYGFIDERYRWYDGAAGFVQGRYGLTDAFDLQLEVSTAYYPKAFQLVPGARAGMTYAIDISRWIPEIGALFGFDDVWTLSCPSTTLDLGKVAPPVRPCGHDLHPSLVIPASLEFRVTRHFALGAQFRYSFMFVGDVSKQITMGASASFMTGD